jgi:hypothetical protein
MNNSNSVSATINGLIQNHQYELVVYAYGLAVSLSPEILTHTGPLEITLGSATSGRINLLQCGADCPGPQVVPSQKVTFDFTYLDAATSAVLTYFQHFSGATVPGNCVPCSETLSLFAPYLVDVTPTLSVQKALGASGRVNSGDQFTVQIVKNGVSVVNPTTNSTTTGNGGTVNRGSGTTGETALVSGTLYTINEVASGSANLGQYISTLTCIDATSGANKALALNTAFSLQANEAISCTLTNTAKPVAAATLQIRQSVLSPVPPNLLPPYTFQYTGNNGWSAPAITNTALNQAQSSAAVRLAATNVATTVSTTLPDNRWFVAAFSCSDLSAPGSGNPTGTLVKSTTPSVTIPASFVRPSATLRCAMALGHATP